MTSNVGKLSGRWASRSAKFLDFPNCLATTSAEQMWAEVERDIPAMVAAARAGTLQQNPALASVARDCLALHLCQARGTWRLTPRPSAKPLTASRILPLTSGATDLSRRLSKNMAVFCLLVGNLWAPTDPGIEDWQRLDSSGLMARAVYRVHVPSSSGDLRLSECPVWACPDRRGISILVLAPPYLALQRQRRFGGAARGDW